MALVYCSSDLVVSIFSYHYSMLLCQLVQPFSKYMHFHNFLPVRNKMCNKSTHSNYIHLQCWYHNKSSATMSMPQQPYLLSMVPEYICYHVHATSAIVQLHRYMCHRCCTPIAHLWHIKSRQCGTGVWKQVCCATYV